MNLLHGLKLTTTEAVSLLSFSIPFRIQQHTMDYEGQRLSELIFYWIILTFGGIGWVIGYFRQEFFIVFKFWLVGVAISIVVRVWTFL